MMSNFTSPLVLFPAQGLPSGMCRCPICRDELVELPETTFSDTQVTLDTCCNCRRETMAVSVTVRRSHLGELLS